MAVGVINFPTSLDDLVTLIQAADNAVTTLASNITSGSTTIPLTSATKFSTSGIATIIDNPASPTLIEIFTYTGKSSNDLTGAGRGAYGTTASAFSVGATVAMRPVARHHIALVEALIEIEKKIGYSSVFRPLDPAGTNQAGANNDFAGGAGTGNGLPGFLAARYPLIGASGTTLQSLSTNRYPLVTSMHTMTTTVTVANTVTETSLFGTASAGSTRTIEAGMARVGQVYRVRIPVFFGTTGTPTGRLRVKVGATTVVDTGAVAFTTAALQSRGYIAFDIFITAVGATGGVLIESAALHYADSTAFNGNAALRVLIGAGSSVIDFTAARAIDVTWEWGTASASNTLTANPPGSIEIMR